MTGVFHDFDLSNFWEDSSYAVDNYLERPADAAMIASVEAELGGIRLPRSFIELMAVKNGGIPLKDCFPTTERTTWAPDHVAISGISGIGRSKPYSLCGRIGSDFMKTEWGYPDIGICVCQCPSAGHDIIMLDYRACGPGGEPAVVHVDQERQYAITRLAKDFETFVRGLVHRSVFDTSAEDLKSALANIERGSFSTSLSKLLAASGRAELGSVLRAACSKVAKVKRYFALHGDEDSRFVYDLQFYLFAKSNPSASASTFLEEYGDIIASGDGDFGTGGYAPDFVEEWLDDRKSRGDIVSTPKGGLAFSDAFARDFERRVRDLS